MKPLACFSLPLLVLTASAFGAVTVPGVFSDHMVLQRDLTVPVWGRAEAGEKITVTFRGQEKSVTTGEDGAWRVKLEPMDAGGPDDLVIAGSNTITIRDVLVGEVWVGSGQSNMAGAAGSYAKKDPELAKVLEGAPYPGLRLLKSAGAGSTWSESTPEAATAFSALLLAFGHRLHEELGVPVGLIAGAAGGTPSGFWLSQEAFDRDAACKKSVAEFGKTYDLAAAQKQYEKALVAWEAAKAKFDAEEAAPAATTKPGQRAKRAPKKPYPPVDPGESTRGAAIGNLYENFIRPVTGFGIRGVLWDQGEAGTAVLGVDQFTLMGALIAGWREEWGQGTFPFIYVQKPSGGGCAWDYENPITREADPFADAPPAKVSQGEYRELHIRIREHPDTWMVTASDLGSMIHPINKWGYGNRAAQVALHAAYGRDTPVYGPTYKSHAVEGNRIRLQFDHVGTGLAFKNGDRLQGFEVAGEDGAYQRAEAMIEGDSVVVWSDDVAAPVAARYAWSMTHPWANLFNADGLPALTFRTDTP